MCGNRGGIRPRLLSYNLMACLIEMKKLRSKKWKSTPSDARLKHNNSQIKSTSVWCLGSYVHSFSSFVSIFYINRRKSQSDCGDLLFLNSRSEVGKWSTRQDSIRDQCRDLSDQGMRDCYLYFENRIEDSSEILKDPRRSFSPPLLSLLVFVGTWWKLIRGRSAQSNLSLEYDYHFD